MDAQLRKRCAAIAIVISLVGAGYAVYHDFTTTQWILGFLACLGFVVVVSLMLTCIHARKRKRREDG